MGAPSHRHRRRRPPLPEAASLFHRRPARLRSLSRSNPSREAVRIAANGPELAPAPLRRQWCRSHRAPHGCTSARRRPIARFSRPLECPGSPTGDVHPVPGAAATVSDYRARVRLLGGTEERATGGAIEARQRHCRLRLRPAARRPIAPTWRPDRGNGPQCWPAGGRASGPPGPPDPPRPGATNRDSDRAARPTGERLPRRSARTRRPAARIEKPGPAPADEGWRNRQRRASFVPIPLLQAYEDSPAVAAAFRAAARRARCSADLTRARSSL